MSKRRINLSRIDSWWYLGFIAPMAVLVYLIWVQSDGHYDIAKHKASCHVPTVDGSELCSALRARCDSSYYSLTLSYYCSRLYPMKWLTMAYSVGILLLICVCILGLGVLMSNYLVENLNRLAELLKINNQVLSFLIVPLTNCLPDLINYNIALRSNSIELALGQLIGSCLISFTIIIGLISCLKSFDVRSFKLILLNFVWVAAILFLFDLIIWDGVITVLECALMSMAFVVYITYLIWYDQRIMEVTDDSDVQSMSLAKSLDVEETFALIQELTYPYESVDDRLSTNSAETHRKSLVAHSLQLIVDCIDLLFFFISPTTSKPNAEGKTLDRFKSLLRASGFMHVWYVCISFSLLELEAHVGGLDEALFLLVACILVVGACRQVLQSYMPEYVKSVYGIAALVTGIVNSLVVVSMTSVFVLRLIKNLGVILTILDYLLGMLVFSIVNCINDIVMNTSLAIAIDPILGLNSCLGSPMLNVLVGLGVNGLGIMLRTGESQLKFNLSTNLKISTVVVTLMIGVYLLYIPFNHWRLDRKLGVFCFFVWGGVSSYNYWAETR